MAAPQLKKLLAIGAGIGIEIGERDLRIAISRVRPSGARVLASATIAGFRERPAGEWGSVYTDFARRAGAGHLSATVLLPRRDVIVRQISLPGVSPRDLENAIRFQVDSLHPFAEEDAAYAWARLGDSGAVLVAIVRRDVMTRYIELFSEAGVRVSSFTISAAAIYSALRLTGDPPRDFLAFTGADGVLEAYGESESRAQLSAAFDMPLEKAAPLAAADLRLGPDVQSADLGSILPHPSAAPSDYDLSRSALAYAASLAGACPRLALAVNLLPAESRSTNSRLMYVPAAVLALALICCVIALASITPVEDRRYLSAVRDEVAKLQPRAERARQLDSKIEAARARTQSIDGFRSRSKADLNALAELTKLLEPPAYLNSLELTRDAATMTGFTEQAATLLKTIDGSPLFSGSKFTTQLAHQGRWELFRVRADRKGAK